jgi:succinate dehydrogenase / fumarate reductase flavoprotein subunit
MQGLADGYFILPYTVGDYLASSKQKRPAADAAEFKQAETEVQGRVKRLLGVNGRRTITEFHRRLGKILWENCGMARNAAGLKKALQEIPALRKEFWQDVKVPGEGEELNQALERAGRVADFLELGELLCMDALAREESCGCHLREEHQMEDGECRRDDEKFAHVAAWEFQGDDCPPTRHVEPLNYEGIHLATRSYK